MSFFKNILTGKKPVAQKKPEAPKPQQPKPAATPAAPAAPSASSINLSAKNILTQQAAADKSAVLKLIADKMLELGYVSADYTEALVGREKKVSTYLINGVAIPHGTVEAKHLVQKTGLVIVQVPKGVLWSDKGEVVKFAVGIAASGQEHLAILQKLTTVVMDEALAKKLCETATVDEIVAALSNKKAAAKTEAATDLNVKKTAKIVDPSGMHARPASIISETSAEYKGYRRASA